MLRSLAKGGVVVALACVCLQFGGRAEGAPAVVIRGGTANVLGADADGNAITLGTGQVTSQVENDNMVIVVVHGRGLTNDSGRAQVFRGFPCAITLADGTTVTTNDTHSTLSASGNAVMVCKFRKP